MGHCLDTGHASFSKITVGVIASLADPQRDLRYYTCRFDLRCVCFLLFEYEGTGTGFSIVIVLACRK